MPLAYGLREPGFQGAAPTQRQQSIREALPEALRYPSFLLLTAGYFVCGFQVVFIGVHMPSYLQGPRPVAPGGQLFAGADRTVQRVRHLHLGHAGPAHAEPHILAFIYFSRAVVITVFLLVPLSPASVYMFSAVMGALWLSTVPPTNATVAQIFGVQHLSMLGGLVFFSHQIGSFMGVWLGGYLYDSTGSYDIVWYIAIALGRAGRAGKPAHPRAPPARGTPLAA